MKIPETLMRIANPTTCNQLNQHEYRTRHHNPYKDNTFARFLATILTPADAEKWYERMIDDHAATMLEITEDVQAEVLQDFLLRQSALSNTSQRSMQSSMSMNNISINPTQPQSL
ncbi:MAG: hypothetical protein N3A63_07105 [Bacteroidetes bacterium]|nr:hypothetical protein [Bacteroidota bacterium]